MKLPIYGLSAAVLILIIFLGANFTGLVVYKTEYNELCKEDFDCPKGNCCLIYEDKNLGLCMENCQSIPFLCRSDDECQIGTVCCIPEGKEFSICNYKEKCLDVDVFAEYVGKTTFIDPEWAKEKKAALEMPVAVIDSKKVIIFETAAIIILLIAIIYLILKRMVGGKNVLKRNRK